MPQENQSVTPVPKFDPPDTKPPTTREQIVAARRAALNVVKRLDELLEQLAEEPPEMV